MIKFMSGVMQVCCGILLAVLLILAILVCIATPEKTKHGTYTDIYKYWTDDVYLCRNFNCDKGNAASLVK